MGRGGRGGRGAVGLSHAWAGPFHLNGYCSCPRHHVKVRQKEFAEMLREELTYRTVNGQGETVFSGESTPHPAPKPVSLSFHAERGL